MFILAVLVQAFAVVPGQNDQRICEAPRLIQKRHQTADLSIREGYFPVVGVPPIWGCVGFGRGVRVVGIIKVDQQDERAAWVSLQPAQRFFDYHVAPPFYLVSLRFVQMAEIEVVEVGFKALVQSVGGVKHGSADEGTRGIAVLAQDFRRGHRTRGNLVNGKVVHARGHGKAAGKEGGVGGQSKRYGSIGVAEPRGRARQGINVRSLDLTVAITAQVVSPQRVDGNENYVGLRLGCLESGRGRDQTKGEGRGPKKDGDEVKVLSPPSHVCSKSDDAPEHYTPQVTRPPENCTSVNESSPGYKSPRRASDEAEPIHGGADYWGVEGD